jgi:hypothetical protein
MSVAQGRYFVDRFGGHDRMLIVDKYPSREAWQAIRPHRNVDYIDHVQFTDAGRGECYERGFSFELTGPSGRCVDRNTS